MDTGSVTILLWAAWIAVVIFFAVSSAILLYHWRSYSSHNDKNIRLAKHWYFGITLAVILITFVLILFI